MRRVNFINRLRTWPSSHPPTLRFGMRFIVVGIVAAVAHLVAMNSPQFARDASFTTLILLSMLAVIIGATALYLLFLRRQRVIFQIVNAGHPVCGHCAHNLAGLHGMTGCPECGAQYDIEKLQSYWRRYIFLRSQRIDRSRDWSPPRWLVKRERWLLAIAVGIVLLFFIGPFIFGRLVTLPPRTSLNSMLMVPAGFVIPLTMVIGGEFANAGASRRIAHANAMICSNCGAATLSNAKGERCPTCSRKYSREQLQHYWDRYCPPHWEIEGVELAK